MHQQEATVELAREARPADPWRYVRAAPLVPPMFGDEPR
jgi:hypothetical protein